MAKIHPYDGAKTFCDLPVSGVKNLTLVPSQGTCGACKQAIDKMYRSKIEASGDKDIAKLEFFEWYNKGKEISKKKERRIV